MSLDINHALMISEIKWVLVTEIHSPELCSVMRNKEIIKVHRLVANKIAECVFLRQHNLLEL